MLRIANAVAVVVLLVLAAAVVLMFWILCKAAKEELGVDQHPPTWGDFLQDKAKENPCETCVRYEECQAVDENCPVRR